MASGIRGRHIVESPLPALNIGPNHTTSCALHNLRFDGDLVPWSNFLRAVESTHNDQPWRMRVPTSPYTPGPHNINQDTVHVGDEHGVQGRFQQAIGEALGAVLEAMLVPVFFADFKSSGSTYTNTPDVVALRSVGNDTTIKVVGELKVPWVWRHNLQTASEDITRLRVLVAQPLRDMKNLGCEYGFLSTYSHTIFLRQFESSPGVWEAWFSPCISSTTPYYPTSRRNEPNHSLSPQVTMKQCMFHVCTLASVASAANNQSAVWVSQIHI